MKTGSDEHARPLVQTKMDLPLPSGALIEQPELVKRLAASHPRVVLVEAPAGWGKTSLLASLMNAPGSEVAFAFVRLGRGDNDAGTFWSYVVASLRRIDPSLAPNVDEGLQLSAIDPTRSVVPSVVNSLRELQQPVSLVLDDYHLITEADVHRSVDFLLENAPSNLTVILSTRFDPPLQLQQYRVGGELVEIRSGDLRLDAAGAQKMFADRFGLELDIDVAQTLCDKTEGWPAGVQLAALSCASDRDPATFIASFSGTDRNVVDYLTSEVLSRVSDQTRAFLLRTSILDELSAGLCDAVVGSNDSATMLEKLEQDAMFLVPLDSERQWFRYHHLFGDWLRHTLNRTAAQEVPELHRRARLWHSEYGRVDQAIDHAIAAGDIEDAAQQINAYLLDLPFISSAPAPGWFDAIPDETAAKHPAIVVALIFRSMAVGDAAATLRWEKVLAEALPSEQDPIRRQVLIDYGRLHRGTMEMLGGDPSLAEAEFQAVADEHPVGSHLLGSLARGLLGLATFITTGPDASIDLLREGAETRRRLSILDGGTTSILAAAYAELGRWPEAESAANEALQLNPLVEGVVFPSRMPAHYALGQVLDSRGKTDEAVEQIELGLRLARRWPIPTEAGWGCLLMSRIIKDREAKRRYVTEAVSLGARGRIGAQIEDAQRRLAAGTKPKAATGTMVDALTPREIDVMRLMRSELTLREISVELYVSYNTVKGYSKTIYQKLAVSSRAEAVETAADLGII